MKSIMKKIYISKLLSAFQTYRSPHLLYFDTKNENVDFFQIAIDSIQTIFSCIVIERLEDDSCL